MFPFFRYTTTHHHLHLLFIFSLLLIFSLHQFPARRLLTDLPAKTATWHAFVRFLDAGKGTRRDGMAELKRYFSRFGYLPTPPENQSFSNLFDDEFETAIINYQKNFGLLQTGKLDSNTMKLILSPRCGVADSIGKRIKTTRKFDHFYGNPRWDRAAPVRLTYAFSPTNRIDYVSFSAVQEVFRRSFDRWSAAIPVNFTEVEDYTGADVTIGWYNGDHGDGEAFDGVLGILAHAFSPENGRFHFDAAERWAVDFREEKSRDAIDLESVATHEIGHVLGMAHSKVKEAIMFPSLSPRTKKVDLQPDDVEGIQALYGSNPDYKYDARLESDTSSGCVVEGLLVKWSVIIYVIGGFWCLFSRGL